MILGASHITLAATDLGADLAVLSQLGYGVRFIEEGIPSHPAKERFLSKPYKAHSLAYASAAKGLPIELVRYDTVLSTSHGCMIPVFDQAMPAQAQRLTGLHESDVPTEQVTTAANPVLAALPRFGTPAYFSSIADGNGGLVAVEIAVGDIVGARRFWECGLGYRLTDDTGDRLRLDFRSPMAAWRFTVFMRHETSSGGMTFLDSSGVACLSMICTDLSKDRNSILALNGLTESTGPFEATVNAQQLCFELFKGPGGVYVELFQVKSTN